MNILKKFVLEFNCNHDFNSPDLELLYERHPSVNFIDIPDAWILPIDEMLARFRYTRHTDFKSIVKEVKQEFGQLVVKFHSFVRRDIWAQIFRCL